MMESSTLPAQVKAALMAIANQPLAPIPAPDLIRELLERNLVEWTHGGAIRFTEQGRRAFHDLRGSTPAPDELQESKSAELFPPDVQPR